MQGTGGNWSYNRACTLTLPSHHKPSARSNFGIKKIKNVLSQPLSCECCCITACCFNPSTTPAPRVGSGRMFAGHAPNLCVIFAGAMSS